MLEVGMRRSPVVPIHMWHYILKPNFEEGHSSGAKSIAIEISNHHFSETPINSTVRSHHSRSHHSLREIDIT
ncbi:MULTISPECIES: hypothetical protein [unclassified Microcoleus]|uniref:hypothetical protein n=1 Tax=unclassified Microcoleus TaxID=2642155 RepID=UPI0025E05FE3|nr:MULTISPECIES: hypothetical protein [unclassified Microcoleus]